MNRFNYRACLLALLPLLTPAAWAARDCDFSNSNVNITGAAVSLTLTGKVSGNTLLTKDVKANYSGVFTSHCQGGNDGQNLWGEITLDGSGYRWHEPGALFPTNIPGIRYSVHVKPREKPSLADGYLPNSSEFTKLVEIGDGADNEGGPLDFGDWDIYLDFYQTEEYTGNQGQSKVHPLDDIRLGSYRLGGSGHDGNTAKIYVSKNSFSLDITTPTCTSAIANGTKDNTVDFGNIDFNDFEANRVPKKNFTIKLSNCSLVNGVTTQLTALNVSSDGNMLANDLTSGQSTATGAGVQIRDVNNNTLRPNDRNSTSTVNNLNMPGTVVLNYSAELRTDGTARKAGAFQSTGVFTMTYQ
jgi:type 1 fimbria pilin